MSIRRAGIALGSNLGDSAALIDEAVSRLIERAAVPGEPVLRAPILRTAPVDCPPGSPDFINTVVEIAYAGQPLELLAITQEIETSLGRVRSVRNAPRLIDLDLLYLGNILWQDDRLTLPHPRMFTRPFVLGPLSVIRPDLVPQALGPWENS